MNQHCRLRSGSLCQFILATSEARATGQRTGDVGGSNASGSSHGYTVREVSPILLPQVGDDPVYKGMDDSSDWKGQQGGVRLPPRADAMPMQLPLVLLACEVRTLHLLLLRKARLQMSTC